MEIMDYDMAKQDDDVASLRSRYTRRLSDKIIIAFHSACDNGDYEVARGLLVLAESLVRRPPFPPGQERRRNVESLVAAHYRLWQLLHPE